MSKDTTGADLALASAIGLLVHMLSVRGLIDMGEYTKTIRDLAGAMDERGASSRGAFDALLKVLAIGPMDEDQHG